MFLSPSPILQYIVHLRCLCPLEDVFNVIIYNLIIDVDENILFWAKPYI